MKPRMLFKEEIAEKEERNQAIFEGRKALNNIYTGTLEIFGKKIKLDKEIAHGGFKKIFDIGDGKVIALRNTNDGTSSNVIYGWLEGVDFEYGMSQKLRNLGLYSQDYEKVEAKIDGHKISALMMTGFKSLLLKNLQLRGTGRHDDFGTSMLFGTKENFFNESYFKNICKDAIKDIITLIINKINLPSDAFGGVVIEDTPDTPNHDRNIVGTIIERKQKVRLFFMDFYEKYYMFQKRNLKICDHMFKPNINEIRCIAELYTGRCVSNVIGGMSDFEKERIDNDPSFNFNEAECSLFKSMTSVLLDEVVNGVLQELNRKKISQFDKVHKLERSMSCNSIFYKPIRENKEPELNLESLQQALFDDMSDEDFDRTSLRKSIK